MTRFNLSTERLPSGKTHEGAAGYLRSPESELFLRATAGFAGEEGCYEPAVISDARMARLATQLAIQPGGWAFLREFLPWLRTSANIRSAPIMLALEAVRARLLAGQYGNGNRQLVAAVLQRADEPAEAVAYWLARYTRKIPQPVKRGVADAAARLYSERASLRWDKPGRVVRFADVLELCHPRARSEVQGTLFAHLISARRGRRPAPPVELSQLTERLKLNRLNLTARHTLAGAALRGDPVAARRLELAMAGSFEWLLSWLGEGEGEREADADEG